MRAVLQRVREAAVTVEEAGVSRTTGKVGLGLLALVGIEQGDDESLAVRLAERIANLRMFPDPDGLMNRSLLDVGGSALVVSQFTLVASTEKGRRPSFSSAAEPVAAAGLVATLARALEARGIVVKQGEFGAQMQVSLVNDGPVTFVLDQKPRRSS